MTCTDHASHAGPGKFEGSPCYVPTFYDQDADRSEELATGGFWMEFILTAADREDWPELAALGDQRTLRIFEDNYGFVYEVSWEPSPDSIEGYEPDDANDDFEVAWGRNARYERTYAA